MSISRAASRKPTRTRIALAVVLFVIGGALVVTLFLTVGPTNGPVQLQEGNAECAESSMYDSTLFGVDISNNGSSPATLTSFTPGKADGVRVKHVWFYDPEHDGKIGVGVGAGPYPKTGLPNWKYRAAVNGVTIPTGHDVFLAVLLDRKPGVRTGQLAGGTIRYTANGLPYSSEGGFVIGFQHGNKGPCS